MYQCILVTLSCAELNELMTVYLRGGTATGGEEERLLAAALVFWEVPHKVPHISQPDIEGQSVMLPYLLAR